MLRTIGIRPFFCQVEAMETVIWLIEVAPQSKNGRGQGKVKNEFNNLIERIAKP
jgi:hypothetical protein